VEDLLDLFDNRCICDPPEDTVEKVEVSRRRKRRQRRRNCRQRPSTKDVTRIRGNLPERKRGLKDLPRSTRIAGSVQPDLDPRKSSEKKLPDKVLQGERSGSSRPSQGFVLLRFTSSRVPTVFPLPLESRDPYKRAFMIYFTWIQTISHSYTRSLTLAYNYNRIVTKHDVPQ
jgi:hypothetical protein